MSYSYTPMGGLLPKALSPTHYLKKVGLMPKGAKAPVEEVEPPVQAIEPGMMSPQQLMLLGIAGAGLVVLLIAGRK